MDSDLDPTPQLDFPTLLVVDATPQLLATCRDVAAHAGLLVRRADPVSAHALAKGRRTVAIVVPESAFWPAAVELDLLAAETNACLIPVANGVSKHDLEDLVAAACR